MMRFCFSKDENISRFRVNWNPLSYLGQMYPPELEIKDRTESNTSASYLDLLLSIGRDGQLRTSLYDKRDDFNFHITNFPFLSSNTPSSPAYDVFISQLIRYARACSYYECFILRAMRHSNKLLGQGICQGTFEIASKEVLWSVRGSYQTIWSSPLPNVTRHSGWWPHTLTPFIDRTLHQFLTITNLDLNTEFDFFTYLCTVSIEHMQRVRHANRGRLHLVLSHFGTCMCSNVETNLFWTCLVSGLLNFEYPSVLLFCFSLIDVLFKPFCT